jgi:hypothetical protein
VSIGPSSHPLSGVRTSLLIASVAIAIVGCGSREAGQGSSEPADVDAKIAECLRDRGESSSLINVDHRRQENPAFDRAVVDCARESDVELPAAGEQIRAHNTYVFGIHDCLRDRGWDVPPPVAGEAGSYQFKGADIRVAEERREALWEDFDLCSQRVGEGEAAPSE